MKRLLITILFYSCIFVHGQTVSDTLQIPVSIGSYLFPEHNANLPVYYYPFYNDLQLIEVGYFEQSLEQASFEDQAHPWSGSYYHRALQANISNGFLLRNCKGEIIENFGVNDLKKLKLISPDKSPRTFYHNQRLSTKETHTISLLANPDSRRYYGPAQSGNEYIVRNEKGICLVDTFGIVRLRNYQNISRQGTYFTVWSENSCGLFNPNYKQVIPFKYSALTWFSGDQFIARSDSGFRFISAQDVPLDTTCYQRLYVIDWLNHQAAYQYADKFGLIDSNLVPLTAPIYSSIEQLSEKLKCVTDSMGYLAILRNTGEQTTPFAYYGRPQFRDDGYFLLESKVLTENRRRLVGLIDSLGNEIIAPKYTSISNFWDGIGIATKEGKQALITPHGKELTPFKYDKILPTQQANYYLVGIGAQYGLIDRVGHEILTITYSEVLGVQDSMVLYKGDNGHYGYINLGEGEDIPPQYDWANLFINGIAVIHDNNKRGAINKSGRELTGYKYDIISAYNGVSGIVKDKGKWGAIDSEGNIIVPLIYERLEEVDEGLFFSGGGETFLYERP